ncbi:MAG: DUF1186 family protein [Clostridium sp.]|nr:DUF1186 family protein [Clostridium sp.]
MAKNKKKNKGQQQQTQISPERYMREKARTLPIGKCYITSGWKESGISQIIVTRVRPSGNLAVGLFLVDTFCVGVKDATYYANMYESDFEDLLERLESGAGLEEISYNEAHNIIYGAIEFAEEGGIQPAKDFKTAGYILEEDTDDIPLIEYEFGKDGKHFLFINSDKREMPYFRQLKKTLGDDFHYVMSNESDEFDGYDEWDDEVDDSLMADRLTQAKDNWDKMMEESERHPDEIYSYEYPEYPDSLIVKNQFIADELLSKDNMWELPKPVIERILALPHDEAAEDIAKIVMYEIGRTYNSINDDTIGEQENDAIIHSLYLLTQLKSEKGLDAVLEIMRQNDSFIDYHLGDIAMEVIYPALYACGMNRVPEIEAYLNQPGLDSYVRSQAFEALVMIVYLHPERREEIIEVIRKIMKSWVSRLPRQEACDGSPAGFLMVNLIDLEAKELIPEIKAVFETDCVDKNIAGDCDYVLGKIQEGNRLNNSNRYEFPDIHKQYAHLKSFRH